MSKITKSHNKWHHFSSSWSWIFWFFLAVRTVILSAPIHPVHRLVWRQRWGWGWYWTQGSQGACIVRCQLFKVNSEMPFSDIEAHMNFCVYNLCGQIYRSHAMVLVPMILIVMEALVVLVVAALWVVVVVVALVVLVGGNIEHQELLLFCLLPLFFFSLKFFFHPVFLSLFV